MSLQEPRELGGEAKVDLLHDESFPTASTAQREIQVSHRDRPVAPFPSWSRTSRPLAQRADDVSQL